MPVCRPTLAHLTYRTALLYLDQRRSFKFFIVFVVITFCQSTPNLNLIFILIFKHPRI